MAHECLCGDHTQLLISLLVALEDNGHHFLSSLHKLEVLLLAKFECRDLVIQHANVLVLCLALVGTSSDLGDVGLVAKGDTPEELNQHLLVHGVLRRQDSLSLLVIEGIRILQLIRQVIKAEILNIRVVLAPVRVVVLPIGVLTFLVLLSIVLQ